MTSNSGPWLPTPEIYYNPKLFNDPRGTHSDKENMLPLETAPMPVLNIEESDFLDRTEKQVPPPESSSPYPKDNQPGSSEQLEPKTEDYMDVRDFSERPINDKRPTKPARQPKVMLQNLIPLPDCPDYMALNAAVMGIPKP